MGGRRGLLANPLLPIKICANMASDPHIFVGDYFYQETRREAIDVEQLRDRTVWIHDMLEENRPEAVRPKYIFVLRDGLSEGQFAMVGDSRVPPPPLHGFIAPSRSFRP